jgi:hypothetical protein
MQFYIQKSDQKRYFYCAVIKKANKSDTSKPIKSLKNLIRKGFDLAIIVPSLREVYFAKHIRQSASTAIMSNW